MAKEGADIVLVHVDDWCGVYIDGLKVFENHTYDVDRMAQHIQEYGDGVLASFEEDYAHWDWFVENGKRMADRLSDVVMTSDVPDSITLGDELTARDMRNMRYHARLGDPLNVYAPEESAIDAYTFVRGLDTDKISIYDKDTKEVLYEDR